MTQSSGGRSREDRTRRLDRTLFTRRGRESGLLDRPRERATKGSKGRLLSKEGAACRARVPEHKIVHGFAPLQFGGSQRGAETEPDHTEPGRPEASGVIEQRP